MNEIIVPHHECLRGFPKSSMWIHQALIGFQTQWPFLFHILWSQKLVSCYKSELNLLLFWPGGVIWRDKFWDWYIPSCTESKRLTRKKSIQEEDICTLYLQRPISSKSASTWLTKQPRFFTHRVNISCLQLFCYIKIDMTNYFLRKKLWWWLEFSIF